MRTLTRIGGVEEFVDYVHYICMTYPDTWEREKFLALLHRKILLSMNDPQYPVQEEVCVLYFKLASLLKGKTITRHRILATIDGLFDWYRKQ